MDLWAKLVFSELRLSWKWFEGVADQDAVKANQYFLEAAPQLDFGGYMAGISEVLAVRRKWAVFMDEYPILIAPNSGALPFSIGFDTTSLDATRHQIAAQALMVTVNLLGLPSVAVPTNLVEAPDAPRGLPIGVQVIGPRYLDELALMIAGQVQDDAGAATIIDPV